MGLRLVLIGLSVWAVLTLIVMGGLAWALLRRHEVEKTRLDLLRALPRDAWPEERQGVRHS